MDDKPGKQMSHGTKDLVDHDKHESFRVTIHCHFVRSKPI